MSKQADWDEYFMKIAEAAAEKSKDPSSKMGCVIVNKNKRVVSLGYNGMIQGADESKMTLSERPMKYYFAIHSEMNALIFARRDVTGCTLYNRRFIRSRNGSRIYESTRHGSFVCLDYRYDNMGIYWTGEQME